MFPRTLQRVRDLRAGDVVAVLTARCTRPGGGWQSEVPLRLPDGVRPGRYDVTTIITAGGRSEEARSAFTVG